MMKAKILMGLSATVYLLASVALADHLFNFTPASADTAEQINEPIQQASSQLQP